MKAFARVQRLYAGSSDEHINPQTERSRLTALSLDSLSKGRPEYMDLAQRYDPHAVVNAIHECGHAASYLWRNPTGHGCQVSIYLNEHGCYTGQNRHAQSFKANTTLDLWWFCFNKMSGVGAEFFVFGHEFDDYSGFIDTFQLIGYIEERAEDGLAFSTIDGNPVSDLWVRMAAIQMSYRSLVHNPSLHYDLVVELLKNEDLNLESYVANKHGGTTIFEMMQPTDIVIST